MENRQPAQPQQQLRVGRELQARRGVGRADVDVWLIEAVEEDKGVCPCLVEPMRYVRNAVKKGVSFTAIGMRSTRFSSRTTSTSDCSTAAEGTLRSVTNS
jgi:hypothetical protein